MSIDLAARARRTAWRAKHRRRPLKAAIHGACQADAMHKMLAGHPSCAGNIEFIPLEENFKMTDADIEQFEKEIAPQLDVFIFQPDRGVAFEDKFTSFAMVQHLRPDCLWISFPIIYMSVYAPFFNYPLPELGKTPFEYIDFAVVAQFLKGVPAEQAAAQIARIELDDSMIEELINQSIESVEARETGEMGQVDVLISPFLRENLRKEKLFHTINHPGLAVMSKMAEGVLDRLHALGALDHRYAGEPFDDHLDQIRLPIHPSIQKAFGLAEDSEFFYKQNLVTEQQAIDTTYAYLAGVDRDVLEDSLRHQTAVRPWFAALS